MEINTDLIGAFLTGLGGSGIGAGIAWGVLRTQVTGLQKDIDEHKKETHREMAKLEAKVERVERDQSKTMELLARLETKLDMLIDKRI